MDFLSLIWKAVFARDRRDVYIVLTAPAVGYMAAKLLASLASAACYSGVLPKARIYRAPTQQSLSGTEEEDEVPYPPDALPGGRNISTPYGNTRAYEWGPEDGRKVLFIHGISTPCIALALLANQLVVRGCRVLLYDLPGRGYSDASDPNVYRQDIQLFSSQILAVLASSPLNWTNGFTLLGYSLGGGIAASFTYYYPDMVESLVLLAPGGVLRTNRLSYTSKMLYSGLFPDWLVHYLVGSKLRAASEEAFKGPSSIRRSKGSKIDVTDAAAEEVSHENSAHAQDSYHPLFEDRPQVSAASAVAWQVKAHPGFVPAFVSSVSWAPIHDGHEQWRTIGKRCEAKRRSPESRGLEEGKVLVMLGSQDVVISSDQTAEDATAAFGQENIRVVRLKGGHDLAITNNKECANTMVDFWSGAV